MKEELLHFIWQTKLFSGKPLSLTTGESLEILSPGIYNKDAGPDFFNARIKIENTMWAGNIEFHVLSSAWKQHGHHTDKVYDNVILHVVYHHDTEVCYPDGTSVPTLELKQLLPPVLLNRYEYLQKNQTTIPCEKIFRLPDEFKFLSWKQRLLIERLERKVNDFEVLLNIHKDHWEQAFYIFTARYFGMKTNAQPFEWLAEKLPLSVIAKHKNNELQLQALCFGVAGFLRDEVIAEFQDLVKEYAFLKHKHNLDELDKSVWKFARIRPANFPIVRIEQFADLLFHSSHLLSKVIAATTLQDLFKLYQFKQNGKTVLSKNAIALLLMNSVLPVVFLYGKHHQQRELCDRVIGFYEELKAENNHIIQFWQKMGVKAKNAGESQALIELKNQYCDEIKCLNCIIGQNILLHE